MTSASISERSKWIIRGLYLVTDRELCLYHSLEDIINFSIKGGVSVVQLREKKSTTSEFLQIALNTKRQLINTNVPLIINDRVDIALASRADGVHLGQSDMPVAEARKILGPDAIIGLSVETWEDIYNLPDLSLIDYIGVSPIFATPTKSDTKGEWGLDGLKKIRAKIGIPLVAIGGINATNASSVIEAGADSLAVVSYLCSAKDPETEAKKIKRLF